MGTFKLSELVKLLFDVSIQRLRALTQNSLRILQITSKKPKLKSSALMF